MTKYGHYLAALDRDCPVMYRGKFLAYKRLKKCLKRCQAAAAAAGRASMGGNAAAGTGQGTPAAEADLERCQLVFFELLSAELAKANSCFVATAKAIVARYQRAELRRRLACCFPAALLAAGPAAFAGLADRAYWCRKYARANAVALRKILKKYDKLCGGQRGRSFLQHCWQLPTGGAFLHSPLLDELKAIQDMLQEPRMQLPEDTALCEVADTCGKAGREAAHTAAMHGKGASPKLPAAVPAPILLPHDKGGAVASPSSTYSEPAALRGVVESPTCMLSSSDFDWAPEEGCSARSEGAPAAAADAGAAAEPAQRPTLRRPSQGSAISSMPASAAAAGCSAATSPRSTGSGRKLMQLLRGVSHAHAHAGNGGSASTAGTSPPEGSVATEHCGAAPPCTPPPLPRNASRFADQELCCPICLDTLYKPVGLACGHKFCKECALGHAGLARAIGTFANLASYVRSRTACPQCRQPGVYREAMRLRQLDRIVRARFPREWEERRREERAAKSLAVEQATGPAHRSWVHTINARDALLAI